jgi:hypothetical protein
MFQHAVQGMDSHGNLSCPASIFARAQTIADHLLVSPDGGLDAAASIVARYLLPSDPAFVSNVLEMAVALCGIGRSRRARHRREPGGTTTEAAGSRSVTTR